MLLEFNENKLLMEFEISPEGQLYLLNCSNTPRDNSPEENLKKFYTPVELHVTGENPDDHHGAKHIATSGSLSLRYKSHKYYENTFGNKLEFTLGDSSLRVVLHYQFYKNISAVRSWTCVENISDADVGIEYISSFAITGIDGGNKLSANDKMSVYIPHNSWVREVVWKKYTLSELGFDRISYFSTKRIDISNTGTWSSKEYLPMGAVHNSETETTLMWQIENNGSWQWEISDIVADKMYLKLSGPTEAENFWYKNLKPGETFESVKAAVSVGSDFDSALADLTAYRRAIVRRNPANDYLPVIFNDYMNCLRADPTTEKMLPVIDKAAEAGAEYYCMDAGWYADGGWWDTVGEWQPCGWRFPNGMKEVFDYIKSKGMVPGIWLEIEVMGINSPVVKNFSDDCFFMRHGKRVIDHGRYQLDFRNQKVRDYATSVVDRLIADNGIGYIKIDYNIDAGSGTEVNADSFGDGLLSHNRAHLSWIEEIMDKYPELIVENCSSGGLRMDYAMLGLHQIQSVSDQEDYRHNAVIAANCATAVLPEQGAIWSYPMAKGDKNEAPFNMINSMLCRIHLSGEITELSDKQFAYVKEGVDCYKKLRNSIGKSCPSYPLGLNENFKDFATVAYAGEDGGYLSVWRLDGENDTIKIPLSCSSVQVLYPSDSTARASTDNACLSVTLPDKYQAVILKYTN